MAIGDDAAAAGMDLVPSSGVDGKVKFGWREINRTRDYIAQFIGTARSIAGGGTGATTAAGARSNLGAVAASDVGVGDFATPDKIAVYNGSGQLTSQAPSLPGHVVPLSTLQTGFTVTTGQVYVPAAFAAVSGYTICYINSDGRISKGASSRRYKKFIREAAVQADLFAVPLAEFQMRSIDGTADNKWILGYIAEDLAETPGLERFVVHDSDGLPDSIDFIQLLLAQNAQLNDRLRALEEGSADV